MRGLTERILGQLENRRPSRPVDADRQELCSARSNRESKSGVGAAVPRNDKHHRPVTVAKHAREGPFVGETGMRGIAGMGVNPDAGKSTRDQSPIDTGVKMIRDRIVFECNRGEPN